MQKILIDKMQSQPKTIYEIAQERGISLDEAYRQGNRSRVGVVICELDGKETDLDSDWRIGHDIGHVVTEIFLPTAHSA